LTPKLDRERLLQAYRRLVRRLVDEQLPEGYWVGELASSALSTATAVSALSIWGQKSHAAAAELRQRIDHGVRWLLDTQRDDGSWGDTPCSRGNISTTMLVRAALQLAQPWLGADSGMASIAADKAATAYLDRICGPGALAHAEAVRRRYGSDRTFSVPILMNAALAGLIPWEQVPHLPFELAVLPQSWYRFARLPVVSYALPALIAIGQAVMYHRRGQLWRKWAVEPTLNRLRRLQPTSGGFLEAVPLTAFVVMALASCGHAKHPVCRNGIAFLLNSVRGDGSWPIDSNLSVWLTTLSVVALGADNLADPEATRQWLLQQQVRRRHPYTGAEPGGWGWSHLSGSVPDADDTSGALLALAELLPETLADAHAEAVLLGLKWLLDLQNPDGGWPTFCRGWGRLPFDRSASDLTAHALRALASWAPRVRRWRLAADASVRVLASQVIARMVAAAHKGLRFLLAQQQANGAWQPLWFGNELAPEEANLTYGTARVLHGLLAWRLADSEPARRAVQWLLAAQNRDGSWGGDRGLPGTVEETALATDALLAWLLAVPKKQGEWLVSASIHRGLVWLVECVETDQLTPAPIGLYFARLWYYERLYPTIFATQALRRALHLPFSYQ
jgi:squalene-hopene/tetraprenyl-beta-curcumene cyclase